MNTSTVPKKIIPLLFLLLGLFSCNQRDIPTAPYNVQKITQAKNGMVVSAHPLASEVGLAILQKGGNATDAAIAVQFALAVVCPRAGNIGGGGFFVSRDKDGNVASLDYREKAPAAATKDMYLNTAGDVDSKLSTYGHLAVGVPGAIAGLYESHAKYGQLPMAELIQPAIDLARHGFGVSRAEVDRLNKYQEEFKGINNQDMPFIKEEWKVGDLLIQTDLAQTLERIQQNGKDEFYTGETAQLLVKEMQSENGIITMDDLKEYAPKWRTPVEGKYKNYNIISMPPPSSGGIVLLQMLKMAEKYPLRKWGFQSPQTIHTMAEIERRAYADRATHMGDTDFVTVPQDSLLSDAYLQYRMADLSLDTASTSTAIHAGEFNVTLESFETTHTSVVDKEGNAVSITTTLNSNYGSKVMVDGAGFFLNNEMDDFSAKPGVPNQFGLVGAEANAIYPGKRMLSSMTPTIIEKDGELFMVIGSPGGSTIITAVFQVFLNVVEFDMTLGQAIAEGRFHHQWLPDQIWVEKQRIDSITIEQLNQLGHQTKEVGYMAKVKAVLVDENKNLIGGGDPRNADDDAKGW